VSAASVLVTGGGGQLASDLDEQLDGRAEHTVLTRGQLDITDRAAVERALEDSGAGVLVNCAAFHNVDLCETEPEQAFGVNALAVAGLARACADRGAKLVHFSTNYVFDGGRAEPYGEDDLPSPRSVYAASKLSGEQLALAYCPGALVVRAAGLYGLHGSASKGGNFITRILARGREQGSLQVVADQRLSPTFTADLAAAVLQALAARASGVVHLTASGSCSWHELAAEAARIAGLDVPVEPVATEPRPGVADRPLNGVLARPRADALGLEPLRDWREGLADYMARAGLA
jgi:dTDP-4-dehydrorhamnose reductase